jgi:hypothetical protein
VRVFDLDPGRRARLEADPRLTVLPGEDGWAVAEAHAPGPAGLLLLDPYDLLAEWPERLPAVLALAERTTVLLYLYNRAARGEKHFRRYRDFRNRLAQRRTAPRCLGRVPADGFLPRAHHELLLLPGPRLAASPRWRPLREELESVTAAVEAAVLAEGRFA